MPLEDAATIAVRVVPRAGRTAVTGKRGEAWLVRLAAPPVDGAANEALVALIAEICGRPRRDVTIVAGEKSRDKRVRVAGVPASDVHERLAARAPQSG